jgi:hypothetical protein
MPEELDAVAADLERRPVVANAAWEMHAKT